jgi:hypothetical protein
MQVGAEHSVVESTVLVELFVDVWHGNFLTAYLGADGTKNLPQVRLCSRTPASRGTGAEGCRRLTLQHRGARGREAQSRAFLSWPGMEPLYSGVAINPRPRPR